MQGFPPNPYGAPAQAPAPPAPTQYAGHTGATPMQAPVPQQYAPPPAPPAPTAPSQWGPPPANAWQPPSQFGPPPEPIPPQLGGPAYPPQGYGQPAPLQAPPAAPVNLNDAEYQGYGAMTPFVPRLDNGYVFQLLDFRFLKESKYAVDLQCHHVDHPTAAGTDYQGKPQFACQPGREYCYQFNLAQMSKNAQGHTFPSKKPKQELVALFDALRARMPGLTPDNNALLTELQSMPRDRITSLGIMVRLDMRSGKPDQQGRAFVDAYFTKA